MVDQTRQLLDSVAWLSRAAVHDPNRNAFDKSSASTSSSFALVKKQVRAIYGDKCAFCGVVESTQSGSQRRDLSCAHLTPDIANFDDGFETQLDLQSTRNYLLLCGTKGELGTCHHGFDKHLLALVPSPIGEWKLLHCYKEWKLNAEGTGALPQWCQPAFQGFTSGTVYKRVLASRLLKFYAENSEACDKLDGLAETIETVNDLSRSASIREDASHPLSRTAGSKLSSSPSIPEPASKMQQTALRASLARCFTWCYSE